MKTIFTGHRIRWINVIRFSENQIEHKYINIY